MSGLVLPFKNGKVRFTDDAWCRISVETEGIVRDFGCDIQYNMYNTILTKMSTKEDSSLFINGERAQWIITLSDPHCFLYTTQTFTKVFFIPDDPKGRSFYKKDGLRYLEVELIPDNKAYAMVAELSDDDYKIWIQKLTKALPTAKDTSYI